MVGDGMRTENDDVPIRFADSPPLGTEWVGFTSEDFKILALSIADVLAHRGVFRPAGVTNDVTDEELADLETRCIKAAEILEKFKK